MTNKSKEYPINHLKDDIKLFAIKQKLKKQHINKDLTNKGLLGKVLDIVKVERATDIELLFEKKDRENS